MTHLARWRALGTPCILALTALLAAGCGSTSFGPASGSEGLYALDDSVRRAMEPEMSADDEAPAADPRGPARLVIHTADVEVQIKNADRARRDARAIAKTRGGHVQFEGDNRVVLRVPAAEFDAALAEAMALGPVLSREVAAQDVTEEYVDLELRLRVRSRYLAELERLYERGGSIKDLLEIKREMEKVTEEIERIKGRIRFLKDRVSMATITVRFRVVVRAAVDPDFKLPFPWLNDLGIDALLGVRR